MIWEFDLLLFALLIVSAIVAIAVRQLVATVAVLSIYSLLVALLFANMAAVDVAFVEAVLGSAFVGILLLVVVYVTGNVSTRRSRKAMLVTTPLVVAFMGLMLAASVDLPDRGDPESPAALGVASEYTERSLAETETPNVVTAVLADYRALDTLGETLVVFTAALAVALVLGRGLRSGDPATGPTAQEPQQ